MLQEIKDLIENRINNFLGYGNLESAEENLNITLQEITNFNFEPCTDKDICRACVFSQYKLCPHNRYFGSYQESSDDSEKDYIDEINNNLL